MNTTNINNETMKDLELVFGNAVGSGKYRRNEFDKFLHHIVNYGMILMEKIIDGHVEESDLIDMDEVIILSRDNMFSEN